MDFLFKIRIFCAKVSNLLARRIFEHMALRDLFRWIRRGP